MEKSGFAVLLDGARSLVTRSEGPPREECQAQEQFCGQVTFGRQNERDGLAGRIDGAIQIGSNLPATLTYVSSPAARRNRERAGNDNPSARTQASAA